MLANESVLGAVADALDEAGAPPLVLDPVLTAGAGGTLLSPGALADLAGRLARHTTLLTPNRPEAARLLGLPRIESGAEAEATAALRAQGWQAVLLKGGHGEGPEVVDLLDADGTHTSFSHERVPGGPFHGTGCALSSALAAHLAQGVSLPEACTRAVDWVQRLIRRAAADGSWILPHLRVPVAEA